MSQEKKKVSSLVHNGHKPTSGKDQRDIEKTFDQFPVSEQNGY